MLNLSVTIISIKAANCNVLTGKDGSTAHRYSSPQFLQKSTVRWYDTPFFVMVRVRYAFFVKVGVRYVGTLFQLKTQDFSHIAPAFRIVRQKTAETNAKWVN